MKGRKLLLLVCAALLMVCLSVSAMAAEPEAHDISKGNLVLTDSCGDNCLGHVVTGATTEHTIQITGGTHTVIFQKGTDGKAVSIKSQGPAVTVSENAVAALVFDDVAMHKIASTDGAGIQAAASTSLTLMGPEGSLGVLSLSGKTYGIQAGGALKIDNMLMTVDALGDAPVSDLSALSIEEQSARLDEMTELLSAREEVLQDLSGGVMAIGLDDEPMKEAYGIFANTLQIEDGCMLSVNCGSSQKSTGICVLNGMTMGKDNLLLLEVAAAAEECTGILAGGISVKGSIMDVYTADSPTAEEAYGIWVGDDGIALNDSELYVETGKAKGDVWGIYAADGTVTNVESILTVQASYAGGNICAIEADKIYCEYCDLYAYAGEAGGESCALKAEKIEAVDNTWVWAEGGAIPGSLYAIGVEAKSVLFDSCLLEITAGKSEEQSIGLRCLDGGTSKTPALKIRSSNGNIKVDESKQSVGVVADDMLVNDSQLTVFTKAAETLSAGIYVRGSYRQTGIGMQIDAGDVTDPNGKSFGMIAEAAPGVYVDGGVLLVQAYDQALAYMVPGAWPSAKDVLVLGEDAAAFGDTDRSGDRVVLYRSEDVDSYRYLHVGDHPMVIYHADGAWGTPPAARPYRYQEEVYVEIPYGLYRPGYKFVGWSFYADSDVADFVPGDWFSMYPVDVDLYPVWEPIDGWEDIEIPPVVTRIMGGAQTPVNPYDDVQPGDWYYDAVMEVYGEGLMTGVSDERFAPHAATSRAMIVTMLWRLEGEPMGAEPSGFADVDMGSWYGCAVDWAAAFGIVEGADGRFMPNDPITREQFAAILYRYAAYKGYDLTLGQDTNILSYGDAFAVSDWAYAPLQWACGAGLLEGSNFNLMPQGMATRAQAAAILSRFLNL